MPSPEELARIEIDRLLTAAGWAVQDYRQVDLTASRGVALREFPLNPGYGAADYLLYVGPSSFRVERNIDNGDR